MSISADMKKIHMNVGVCIFFAVFGAIYEHFSLGVWSYYMIYAFAPLLIGSFVALSLYFRKGRIVNSFFVPFFLSQMTASMGMLAAGVVAIYGTENKYLIVYPICAALLLIVSFTAPVIENKKQPQTV